MTPQDLDEQFKSLERDWTDALIRQDGRALDQIIAPDYTLTISANAERAVPREAWMKSAMDEYRVSSMTFDKFRATTISDDVVVVSMLCDQKARVAGVDRSFVFFLTDVWRRYGDRWRVAARYSSFPEPESESTRSVSK